MEGGSGLFVCISPVVKKKALAQSLRRSRFHVDYFLSIAY